MRAPLKIFTGSRLPSLDGMRFLAALSVIVGHGYIQVGCLAADGVTFFFVLSGVLFSWMFQREWAKHGRLDFKSFYLRRTFRIIPAFYAAILFTILGKFALHVPIDYRHAAASATFLGNYYNAFHDHPATGFDLFWSLGVEEQFYLLWPLCFALFMPRGPKALAKFLFVAILAVVAWRSYLTLSAHAPVPYLYNAFDTRFDSLALGCLAGLLMMSGTAAAPLRALTRTGLEPLVVIAALAALDVFVIPVVALRFSFGLTAQSFLMGVLLLQLVVLHEHPLWRWLNQRWLVFLGTLSYSTYLYHGWGLAVGHKFKMLPLGLQLLGAVVASVALAYASYRVFELPFQELRRRLSRPRLTKAQALAT